MSESFIGQLMYVSFNFAPKGWAMANGQLLPINQNQALFSLLGTFYGGNGVQNFALPDMRGRTPVHQGQGQGLSVYTIGEMTGHESTTILTGNLPTHTHLVAAATSNGTTQEPVAGIMLAKAVSGGNSMIPQIYIPAASAGATTTLAPQVIQGAGGSQPTPIVQPYLVMTCNIALIGIFPSRN